MSHKAHSGMACMDDISLQLFITVMRKKTEI